METTVEVFEFKKTARHESVDAKTTVVWDDYGKSFVIHGEKKAMFNDKEKRSISFFTMYGEPLLKIERLEQMNNFCWRPRPNNMLKPIELKELKSTYKKSYKKSQREEDKAERAQANESTRSKKKEIRDEFLNNFYLPNRKAYEDNIQ